MDSRFGNPDDWGLSPARHSEIASELGDHLDCLQADEGAEAAKAAESSLAEPHTRRKLTTAHIADQLVSTLLRKPNGQELRELMWLLFWIVLLVGGTTAWQFQVETLGYAQDLLQSSYGQGDLRSAFGTIVFAGDGVVWLLSNLARIGLVCVLFSIIRRALLNGPGVLAARLVQLSAILSVLGVLGFSLVKPASLQQNAYLTFQLPTQFNSANLAAALLFCVLLLLIVNRKRYWLTAVAGCMLAISMWFTGPAIMVSTFGKVQLTELGMQRFLDRDHTLPADRINVEENYLMLEGELLEAPAQHYSANWYNHGHVFAGLKSGELPADTLITAKRLVAPYTYGIANFGLLFSILTLLLMASASSLIMASSISRERPVLPALAFALPALMLGILPQGTALLRFAQSASELPSGSYMEHPDYLGKLISWLIIEPLPEMSSLANLGGRHGNELAELIFLFILSSLFLLLSVVFLQKRSRGLQTNGSGLDQETAS